MAGFIYCFWSALRQPFGKLLRFVCAVILLVLSIALLRQGVNILTFVDSCAENVHVQAIIIPKLEFGDIERQIFFADLVDRPDHTAFDERPEAFDRVRVNSADDILPFGVVDRRMREYAVQALIANPLIGAKQADFIGYSFGNEARKERFAKLSRLA
jgi:hypothetical protein